MGKSEYLCITEEKAKQWPGGENQQGEAMSTQNYCVRPRRDSVIEQLLGMQRTETGRQTDTDRPRNIIPWVQSPALRSKLLSQKCRSWSGHWHMDFPGLTPSTPSFFLLHDPVIPFVVSLETIYPRTLPDCEPYSQQLEGRSNVSIYYQMKRCGMLHVMECYSVITKSGVLTCGQCGCTT